MKSCCAYGCRNQLANEKSTSDPELSFHAFPKDPAMKKQWIKAIRRRKFKPRPNSFVCSAHFKPDAFDINVSGKKSLKKEAVPSVIFSSRLRTKQSKVPKIIERHSPNVQFSELQPSSGSENASSNLESIDDKICAALGCSSRETDAAVKFFPLPENSYRRKEWCDAVGGIKEGLSTKEYICQHHFPRNQFETHNRTALVKNAKPAFRFGPLNPRTRNFCPIGKEQQKIMYSCCAPGCDSNDNGGVRLAPFPIHDPLIFFQWTKLLKVQTTDCTVPYIAENFRVCLKHFPEESIVYDSEGEFLRLELEALPVLHLDDDDKSKSMPSASSGEDEQRTIGRKSKRKKLADTCEPKAKVKIERSLFLGSKTNPDGNNLESNIQNIPEPIVLDESFEDTSPTQNANPAQSMGSDVETENSIHPTASLTPGTCKSSVESSSNQATSQGASNDMLKKLSLDDSSLVRYLQDALKNKLTIPGRSVSKTLSATDSIPRPRVSNQRILPKPTPSKSSVMLMPSVVQPISQHTAFTVPAEARYTTSPSSVSYVLQTTSTTTVVKPIPLPTLAAEGYTTSQPMLSYFLQPTPPLVNPTSQQISASVATKESCTQPNVVYKQTEAFRKCLDCSVWLKKPPKTSDRGVQVTLHEENADEWVDEAEESVKDAESRRISKLFHQKLEVTLVKLFKKNEANAFSNTAPSNTDDDEHLYGSADTVNLLQSAANLCDFNNAKIKTLSNILSQDELAWIKMEEMTIRHVDSILSASGLEFFHDIYEKMVQNGVERNHKGVWSLAGSNDIRSTKEVKQFGVALQMYSEKGYKSLSDVIGLPSPIVARSWATRSDGCPGFSEKSFRLISDEVNKLGKYSIVFCLSVAEVPLNADISWDGEQLFGYSDLGYGQLDDDRVHEASRALVFYGTAVNRHYKLPLGYCLANELSSLTRANIVSQYLCHLDAAGVKCYAVVADCSLTSYEMFRALGIETNEENGCFGAFQHPSSKSDRVYCLFDVFQVTKLVRNYLASCKCLQSRDKLIEWKYVEAIDNAGDRDDVPDVVIERLRLLKLQMDREPAMINKHIMKAMRILLFEGSAATINFFEKLHFLTEVSTSNNPFAEDDRQAVNRQTFQSISSRLMSMANFIKTLKHGSGPYILFSKRRLPIFMLYLNVRSIRAFMKKALTSKALVFFVPTETLLMKNVNQWLAEIVGETPTRMTPLNFKRAYEKFMNSFNLLPSSSITDVQKRNSCTKPETITLGTSHWYSYAITPLQSVSDDVPMFLTRNVIKKLLEEATCYRCLKILLKEFKKFIRGLSYHVNIIKDMHDLLKKAETILHELYQISLDDYDYFFNMWANRTLNVMCHFGGFKQHDHLFNNAAFGEVTHLTLLVKQALRAYLKLRQCFLTRQESISFDL